MSKKPLLRRQVDALPIQASDGATVYELFAAQSPGLTNVGLATGVLKPTQKASPHYHNISEEIYFVISGSGKVTIGDEFFEIGQGDAVFVPVDTIHSLENTSPTEPLVVLCISSPPYSKDDDHSAS